MYIKELEKNKYRVFLYGGKDYKGKEKRLTKTFVAKTKKDLNRQIDEWKSALEVSSGLVSSRAMTVTQMCAEVFPLVVKGKSKNTARGYDKCKDRIDATLGSVKAAELSPHIIQQWIDDLGKMETLHSQEWRSKNKALEKKYYSPKTIKETYSVLSLCCSAAVLWQLIGSNPCHDIMLPRNPKKEAPILTVDDFAVFFRGLNTLDLDTKVLFEVALFGSLRRGEALAMLDVPPTGKRVKISSARYLLDNGEEYLKEVKTPAGERFAVLPSFVIDDIKALRKHHLEEQIKLGVEWAQSEYLIKMPDGSPLMPGRANDRLQSFLKRIGLGHVTFHDLRHTYASMCVYFGTDIETVSKRMGHANIETTLNIYTHLFENEEKGADAIAESFEKLVKKM